MLQRKAPPAKEVRRRKKRREKIVRRNLKILYPLSYQPHHHQVEADYQYGKRIVNNISGYENIDVQQLMSYDKKSHHRCRHKNYGRRNRHNLNVDNGKKKRLAGKVDKEKKYPADADNNVLYLPPLASARRTESAFQIDEV